jgi:hypothetical protein
MYPREFPFFPEFQRFPQYYGFRKCVNGFRNISTVSEICLRFPNYVYGFRTILDRCGKTPRLQYYSIRGTTRSVDFDGIGGSTRGGNEGIGFECIARRRKIRSVGQKIQVAITEARINLEAAQQRQKAYANTKRREVIFRKSDLVLVSTQNLSIKKGSTKKLLPRFMGPFFP